MRSKKRYGSKFDLITIFIAAVVVLTFLLAMLTIIIKGSPYLLESLQTEEVLFAIRLSVITATISTIICVLIALPTAYALVKTNMPFRNFCRILLEIPLSLPYLVIGLSLLLLFSSNVGKELSEWGLKIIFSTRGIVVAHVFVNLPFAVQILSRGFQEVDERLEFVSRMLGATKLKSFLTITIPLIKNTLLGAIILSWSRALGEFGATLMLVGTTRMKTETLPASIFLNMATGNLEYAMSSALLLLLISFLAQTMFHALERRSRSKNTSRVYGEGR